MVRFQQWLYQLLCTVYAREWVHLKKMTGKCQKRETKLWITKRPQRHAKEWEIKYSKTPTKIRNVTNTCCKETKWAQNNLKNTKITSKTRQMIPQKKTQNNHKSFVMTLHNLVTGCVHTIGSFKYLELPGPRSLSTCHWGVFFFS